MKVLVTGASGFLGQSLCRALRGRGDEVTAVSSRVADLRVENSLGQFDGTRFDRIWHLAAWTQAGDFCLRHAGEQWVINQRINTNVLAWWQTRQSQAKLIAIGTSCAYAPGESLSEEDYLLGEPIESLFSYAMTKRMLYAGLLALHKQYGLEYLQIVPSTLYGSGYHTDGRQMHFIFDIIRKVLRAKNQGESAILWGDGFQKRELIYVGDFVRLALHLADDVSNENVNLGSGEEHTIRSFAMIVCELTGVDFGSVEFDLSGYVGAKSKVLKIDKLRSLIGDPKFTSLKDGLKRTVDWFQDNFESIRRSPR